MGKKTLELTDRSNNPISDLNLDYMVQMNYYRFERNKIPRLFF